MSVSHPVDFAIDADRTVADWLRRFDAQLSAASLTADERRALLLLTKGITPARHSGVRGELGRHFFRTGRLPSAWGNLYAKLQEERENATYDMNYEPGAQLVEQRLQWAREFIETARTYLIEK